MLFDFSIAMCLINLLTYLSRHHYILYVFRSGFLVDKAEETGARQCANKLTLHINMQYCSANRDWLRGTELQSPL